MIIESIDGRYYMNPRFIRDTFVGMVDLESDEFVVYSAAKKLPKDFAVETLEFPSGEVIFADDTLKSCRVLQVTRFKKPIPVPDRFDYFFDGLLRQVTPRTVAWNLRVSSHELLLFMQGKHIPTIHNFLGANAKAKIRRQVQILQGAKITDLNYSYYYSKLPGTIVLRRKDACPVADPLA